MFRPFAVALAALALVAPARAADEAVAPEKLLPPTTQFYARWDGVAAHNDAYKKSAWGPVMAGPTGDNIRALLAKGPKLLGSSVLADPLLDGKDPAELKANLADLKAAEKLVELIADKGVLVAAEVREPGPSIRGIGQALGGLIGGKVPGAESLVPDAQLIAVVPDAGDKADVLNGSLRLLMKKAEYKVEPFTASGRKGFRLVLPQERRPITLHSAWWVEGKHFVFYAGTRPPDAVMAEFSTNVAKGGVTAHPLYQRCLKTGTFETVTRGYVDAAKVVGLAKTLAGPFLPGLKERIDAVGFGTLKAVVFASGFEGKESRALYEFDLPGERQGVAKALKNTPIGLNDLPPMPPDVSRFSALRLDPSATYDAGLGVVEFLSMSQDFGVEDDAKGKGPLALIAARKDYLSRETDKFLGISVKDDLLPHLGDKIVMFQSPSEGLSAFGTVICVSCKDPAKVKTAADRVQRALEAVANSPIKVRKKVVKGVEVREFYARGFGVVTPSYAVVGDWLVMAGHPQAVTGVILRTKGDLEKWAPDAETTKRLAKMPQDGCGLQFCNPKSTVQNLCCVGPLFLGTLALRNQFSENTDTDYDPIDVGLVPNGHELSRHLFPNLTITRDDGKTVRIEVNESFSLPLEVIGLEPLVIIGSFAGLVF